MKVHYHRHKMDDKIEAPVNDNKDIPEKLQSIPMSNKKIESWKVQVGKGKSIFVASNVKSIHPVVDRIVANLCKIDLINYVRVTKEDYRRGVFLIDTPFIGRPQRHQSHSKAMLMC